MNGNQNTSAESINSSLGWIASTFRGRDATTDKRDIPGQIGKWLFRVGAIWAAILLPITLLFSVLTVVIGIDALLLGDGSKHSDRTWLLCPMLLAGYAVWVGWGWRSRRLRNRFVSILFWLASAGFNVLQPIHFWMDSHDFWVLLYPPPLWGIITTIASVVALVFEFGTPRDEGRAV